MLPWHGCKNILQLLRDILTRVNIPDFSLLLVACLMSACGNAPAEQPTMSSSTSDQPAAVSGDPMVPATTVAAVSGDPTTPVTSPALASSTVVGNGAAPCPDGMENVPNPDGSVACRQAPPRPPRMPADQTVPPPTPADVPDAPAKP